MRGNGLDTSRPAPSGAANLAGHQDRSTSPLDPPGRSAVEREEASGTTSLARAVLLVLLPFAAGYYLSYLYRSINALIAGDLVAELGLGAADLGLLTSVYFLLFAAVQLPCGVLIDRYGPRLIDSALLLVAAAGSLLFALADGVGNAPCRPRPDRPRRRRRPDGRPQGHRPVAPARARRPRQRLVHHAGRARRPVGDWTGRGGGAGCRLARAVRRSRRGLGGRGAHHPARRAGEEIADADLCRTEDRLPRHLPGPALPAHRPPGGAWRRHILLAAGPVGGALARRRCGARPARRRRASHLHGGGARRERLRRGGIPTELFLAGTLALSMAAQLALLLGLPVPSYVLFAVIAAAGAATVLGRANAALGVLNMGTAFGLQCLSGFMVALWPADDGHYPAEAHQAALGLGLVLQAAAFAWFIRPERKTAFGYLPAHPIHAFAGGLGLAPAAALSYARARHAWSLRMARARAQEKAWRSAAFASFAVLALLVASLGSTILGTSVAAHVIEGAQLTETRAFAGPGRSTPSFKLDRPAELVPASLVLGCSHDLMQEGEPW